MPQKAIERRLRRLEEPLRLARERCRLYFTCLFGQKLPIDHDRVTEILDESGFLPKCRFSVADLSKIPDGLDERGTIAFLRENGANLFR